MPQTHTTIRYVCGSVLGEWAGVTFCHGITMVAGIRVPECKASGSIRVRFYHLCV